MLFLLIFCCPHKADLQLQGNTVFFTYMYRTTIEAKRRQKPLEKDDKQNGVCTVEKRKGEVAWHWRKG
jgi:hypothetical protein